MKYFSGPISMICGVLLISSVSPAQLPSAKDTRNIERRIIHEDDVLNMKSGDLLGLYDRVLREEHLWVAGESHKLFCELADRRDPELDDKLIVLFEKVMEEESAAGRLDSLLGKRVGTRTEELMRLLGRRRTERTLNYMASQATNKHAVVRASIIDSLGTAGLLVRGAKGRMSKVAALLHDDDAEVADRSVRAFAQHLRDGSNITEEAIRCLVVAQDRTPRGTKVLVSGYHEDVRDIIDHAIEQCKDTLTKSQAKAGPGERKELNRLLDIVGNRGSAPRSSGKTE
mgnify:CR=1 FL=1